jgi:hypothetical protein
MLPVIKFLNALVLAMVGLAFCRMLASPLDSLGATVGDEGNNAFGFGEMFTPQQAFSFSGVQLVVTGYDDQNPGPLQDSTLELYLSNDATYSLPSFPFMEPAGSFASGTATINAAGGNEYAFNLSGLLEANTPYWLSLFLVGPDGSIGISANWTQAIFDSADPAGVLVDGYESGVDAIVPPFQPGTAVPVAVVPEASAMPCYLLGWLLLWLGLEAMSKPADQPADHVSPLWSQRIKRHLSR